MHQFDNVRASRHLLSNTLAMGLPVNGVEHLLRPLIAFSEMYSQWFCDGVVPQSRLIMAGDGSCEENEVSPCPFSQKYLGLVLPKFALILLASSSASTFNCAKRGKR
jgi:hypothetical protein